uniref:Lipase_3 domain-containing protein n=1 Tax=Steinernema glaseri TaxID=37863 RepID=A0A1I7YIJ9_9BILA
MTAAKVVVIVFLLLGGATAYLDENEYDDEYARLMLRLSAAAYNPTPEVCVQKLMPSGEQWKVWDYKEVVCDTKGNTCAMYYMVSHVEKKCIIAFRGTIDKNQLDEETSQSLEADADWYGMGLVDKYFFHALDSTWSYTESFLMHAATQHHSVVFTGYSLGGALASLSAAKAVKLGLRPPYFVSLVTFGQPRVGNSIFANNHNRLVPNSYRIVHNADIVPHLPPCRDKGPYGCDSTDLRRAYHHGTEVWYKNDMSGGSNYIICTRSDEDEHCSNSYGTEFKANDHLHYFGHMVSSYGLHNCTDVEGNNSAIRGAGTSVVTALVTVLLAFAFL